MEGHWQRSALHLASVILTKVKTRSQAGYRSLLWVLTFVRMTEGALRTLRPVRARCARRYAHCRRLHRPPHRNRASPLPP
ncbi:hypothetical protein SPHINGO391_470166 [Sphingomonas aurantiaca]|uniref:Uncharacterized protein n=1 Tax=Sphingomonas aurantiaca TaxID=185949 RepID=A0A5E7ZQD2_9SPHN|nr:hypothetical protein SPHINGO391_470166 [Sphingomonas aurantiaca]